MPDGHGNLWVLDPGAPGNEKILEGAPKIVRIDLKSNKVTKVIAVPGDVALQGTYLNDIRFSPDGKIGYITDSGTRGAIIIVDLESGKSHRALDGHASTQIDKTVKVTLDGKPLVRPDGRQPASLWTALPFPGRPRPVDPARAEFLVAADIINTVAVEPTIESLLAPRPLGVLDERCVVVGLRRKEIWSLKESKLGWIGR